MCVDDSGCDGGLAESAPSTASGSLSRRENCSADTAPARPLGHDKAAPCSVTFSISIASRKSADEQPRRRRARIERHRRIRGSARARAQWQARGERVRKNDKRIGDQHLAAERQQQGCRRAALTGSSRTRVARVDLRPRGREGDRILVVGGARAQRKQNGKGKRRRQTAAVAVADERNGRVRRQRKPRACRGRCRLGWKLSHELGKLARRCGRCRVQ